MKTYVGYRQLHRDCYGKPTTFRCIVSVVGDGQTRSLDPRLDLRNHSPTGFEWGYDGSGPAQLALALVADCCGESYAVPRIYQAVKRLLVAGLPQDGWTLTSSVLGSLVNAIVDGSVPHDEKP